MDKLLKASVLLIVLVITSGLLGGFLAWYLLHISGQPSWDAALIIWNHGAAWQKDILIKSSAGIFVALCVLFTLGLIKWYIKRRGMVYGRSELANFFDVKKTGLLDKQKGIFLGYFGSRPLFDDSQQHVCLIAESGTGKGVSLIIPNLFLWSGSVIVSDMKGENFNITSGYRRSRGQDCYSFDPFSTSTHRINPLAYFDEANPIDHLQNMGYVVFPDPEKGEKIWVSNSRQLFIGLALYLYLEKGRDAVTFGNIIMLHTSFNFDELNKKVSKLQGSKHLIDACWKILRAHADTPDKTRGGVDAEFRSRLDIFLNPSVVWATSANDVPLDMMRKEPISLYLNTSPANIERVAFIMKMIQDVVKILHTKEEFTQNSDHKYQLLLLNDEQHNVYGRMPLMLKAASFYRSYGIRIFSVYQSLAQIKMDYGEDGSRAYLDNHHIKIFYCPTDKQKAKVFAAEIGETTIFTTSRSTGSKGSRSKSEAPQKREAFLPEELMKMLGKKYGLLFVAGNPAIKFRKVIWYKNKNFKSRQLPPADVPTVTSQQMDEYFTKTGVNLKQIVENADPALRLADMVKSGASDNEIKATIDSMIMAET